MFKKITSINKQIANNIQILISKDSKRFGVCVLLFGIYMDCSTIGISFKIHPSFVNYI